ncbi:MAG: nucleotide pyrophosphohydrolase [Bdellovibrionales bacterium GWA2_49_15]|nr:MAG: nucleotide pyrophosphohydrolase [Bdellovibrionales bacterium GWA2_49_15]HAZ14459.1 nucleotide pyrophosphohydrolase [Bdellovibrionales bacterium]
MGKEILDLAEWKSTLTAFAKERDWEKFHTPKNLATALSVEASELLELFQWLTAEESTLLPQKNKDEKLRKNIEREMADVLVYLLRLATVLEVDLSKALQEKMAENAKKYPADKVKGLSKKYDQY